MTGPRTNNPSAAFIGLKLVAALWALGTASLAILLLCVADSGRGRLFGLAALLTGVLPLAGVFAWETRARRWTVSFAWGGAAWVLAAVLVAINTPDGMVPPTARLSSQFSPPPGRLSRYSPGNLLPECDQLLLGFTLMAFIDPLFSARQASELKQLAAPLYRELEADADFHAVGSVMSGVYARILGPTGEQRHAYVYVPAGLDRTKPRPVLVFFHGYGGNFKAYSWILAKLADQLGYVLVAPSNGPGYWRGTESAAGLRDALDAAARVAAIDRRHVNVLGLSNGGLAVSRLAALAGSEFDSLIFLSPVFDPPSVHSASFAAQCRERRVLVVTGARDDRVPLDYVEENVAQVRRFGARVTLETFETADHFLIFSHRPQLVAVLAKWYGQPR